MAANGEHARGLVAELLSPLRYDDERTLDPSEAAGIMSKMVPPGTRVLDVGCGSGSLSRLIMDARDCIVLGLEPNADRAAAAASKGLEVVEAEFAGELVDRLGIFDVVLFADVLEHLADPFEALRLTRRFLRVGGRVVASVPNVAHWTIRLNLLHGRFDYQPVGIMDATHLRWFTVRSLHRLFTQAGYRIVESKASAGLWMEGYRLAPWRWLPASVLTKLVHGAAQTWPALFGCQHVIRAEL